MLSYVCTYVLHASPCSCIVQRRIMVDTPPTTRANVAPEVRETAVSMRWRHLERGHVEEDARDADADRAEDVAVGVRAFGVPRESSAGGECEGERHDAKHNASLRKPVSSEGDDHADDVLWCGRAGGGVRGFQFPACSEGGHQNPL